MIDWVQSSGVDWGDVIEGVIVGVAIALVLGIMAIFRKAIRRVASAAWQGLSKAYKATRRQRRYLSRSTHHRLWLRRLANERRELRRRLAVEMARADAAEARVKEFEAGRVSRPQLNNKQLRIMKTILRYGNDLAGFTQIAGSLELSKPYVRGICEQLAKMELLRISEFSALDGCFLTEEGRQWLMDEGILTS